MSDYTPPQIRETLTCTFNASELELLISDHFPDALKDIPVNAALNEQAQKLVTHCQCRDTRDDLIWKIKHVREFFIRLKVGRRPTPVILRLGEESRKIDSTHDRIGEPITISVEGVTRDSP